MKEDLFLSREEFRRRQNEIRKRQERLIQVREESRKMAATVVARMKEEAEKQYQETENRILSEIREYYSRELSAIRQQYDECVSEINEQHYIKQVGINEKNKPVTLRKKPVILKKVIPSSNFKNESKKIESKKELKPLAKEKSSVKKSTANNPSLTTTKKCNTLQVNKNDAKSVPENIVIDSDADNNLLINDNRHGTSVSPNLRRGILKKSVLYHTKDKKPKNAIPRDITKPTEQIMNDILNSDQVHFDVNEKNSSELYNRLVHDRIRVLEQKEKILSRRLPSPLIISDVIFPKKPTRFTEYFSNFRSQSTAHPRTSIQSGKNDDSRNKSEVNEVDNDIARVQLKKKLLALELSHAETQTEKIVSTSSTESDERADSTVRLPSNSNTNKETSTSSSLHNASNNNHSTSAKVLCPSPIPKEIENFEDKSRNDFGIKSKKNCRCRKKQLRKSDDVIVTVSNNKTHVITNSSDSNSSVLALDHYSPQNSTRNDSAPVIATDSHKTVKVIVNVLSGKECQKNRRKLREKQKNVTYAMSDNNFKKTTNWKSIFDNDEKLTESSYFSPPEVKLKNVKSMTKPIIEFKHDKDSVTRENENEPYDLGYYVAKLLMMTPESIENLNISTSESTVVSECDDQRKLKDKVPLNVPLYQNSLDETIETFLEPVNKNKRNESIQDDNISTSGVNENADVSFSDYLKKNVSSLTDSSCFQTDKKITSNASHASTPGNELHRIVEDLIQTSDHSDPKSIERSGTEDDFTLPSIEELKRRGFGKKLFTDKTFIGERDIREEDILEEMLKIKLPISEKKVCDINNSKLSANKTMETIPAMKIDLEKLPVSLKEEIDSVIQRPKFGDVKEFEEQPILKGWMGTTLKRTLEASAITSTSSGDSSDTVRRMLTTFEKPFEGISELKLQSESTVPDGKSSLSPLKVPDLHLRIPFHL